MLVCSSGCVIDGRRARHEFLCGHDMRSRDRKNHQSRAVHLCGGHATLADIGIIERCGGVGKENNFVVAKQGVARGGVTTVFGGDDAVMVRHGMADELIMDIQQAQHAGFIAAHVAAEADDVGEHDRRQLADFMRRFVCLRAHGGDYAAHCTPLSNSTLEPVRLRKNPHMQYERDMPSHRQAANTSPTAIKALEEVRRIVRETVGSENADVHLFGSWARGEATRPSDIDIAIDPRETLPRGTLARLRERLEESHVPYRVDVVDLRRTDSEFRRRVLTEGIPWND